MAHSTTEGLQPLLQWQGKKLGISQYVLKTQLGKLSRQAGFSKVGKSTGPRCGRCHFLALGLVEAKSVKLAATVQEFYQDNLYSW